LGSAMSNPCYVQITLSRLCAPASALASTRPARVFQVTAQYRISGPRYGTRLGGMKIDGTVGSRPRDHPRGQPRWNRDPLKFQAATHLPLTARPPPAGASERAPWRPVRPRIGSIGRPRLHPCAPAGSAECAAVLSAATRFRFQPSLWRTWTLRYQMSRRGEW
jgi:hypothetical protein